MTQSTHNHNDQENPSWMTWSASQNKNNSAHFNSAKVQPRHKSKKTILLPLIGIIIIFTATVLVSIYLIKHNTPEMPISVLHNTQDIPQDSYAETDTPTTTASTDASQTSATVTVTSAATSTTVTTTTTQTQTETTTSTTTTVTTTTVTTTTTTPPPVTTTIPPDGWKKLYAEVIRDTASKSESDISGYSLYDLNRDTIPELFLASEIEGTARMQIFTYRNGICDEIGSMENDGFIYVSLMDNVLLDLSIGEGYWNGTTYVWKDDRIEIVASLTNNASSEDSETTEYQYNGAPISQEDYAKLKAQFLLKKQNCVCLGHDYPLSDSIQEEDLDY